ncbi:hypothetical protein AXX12_03810 [Anaerosporomusa subterranea]|uniref:Uncharacterized protein n=1 Tax=Anaerosporomusa subterranea TaxID=1794912 RepID=A0A154BUT4_ANASB|nr:hypothetical protein [Anaerosporomusa subterranea]KYZ77268.1 hypothetical protein AXX12_03810 [Anaerosporomusa subterranea]
MPTGILLVVLLLVTVFIFVYKRQMLLKMFSINIATMADEFRTQMEVTADQAVKKLENQMAQLEYMLEEADAKIITLENRLREAEQKGIPSAPASVPYTSDSPLSTSIPQSQPAQIADKLQEVAQDKRQQVMLMHRQGYTVIEIAKATSMGKGEVMLVLELNKNG